MVKTQTLTKKTQTLQKTTRQLAGNVGERIEWPVRRRKQPRVMLIEWPVRKSKQPSAMQIGVIVGSVVVVTSALFAARSIRQAIRDRNR
jgi:hypothetical protein